MVVHALLKISHTLTLRSLIHKLARLIDCSSFACARGLSPSLVFRDLVSLGDKQGISMGEWQTSLLISFNSYLIPFSTLF